MDIEPHSHVVVERPLDRLLLDEANHRTANEVAAALAAMHLARSAKGERSRDSMLEMAIARLESFGECSRVLASVNGPKANPGDIVERMCRAMVRSRTGHGPSRVHLDLTTTRIAGETAHHIALIAYELVTNALKYAFEEPGRELEVRLEMLVDCIVLSVIDEGPGLTPATPATTCGDRLGNRIVAEIVQAAKGFLEYDSGPTGTAVHVMLPVR